MKNNQNSQRVFLETDVNYGPSQEEQVRSARRHQVQTEINLSVLPKQQAGKTDIIDSRNSRTAVKRTKEKYKSELKLKSHNTERNAIIHQIVQHNKPKMNLNVIVLN